MSESAAKPGDVVMLRSGPTLRMTVGRYVEFAGAEDRTQVVCFYEYGRRIKEKVIPVAALELVVEGPKVDWS